MVKYKEYRGTMDRAAEEHYYGKDEYDNLEHILEHLTPTEIRWLARTALCDMLTDIEQGEDHLSGYFSWVESEHTSAQSNLATKVFRLDSDQRRKEAWQAYADDDQKGNWIVDALPPLLP